MDNDIESININDEEQEIISSSTVSSSKKMKVYKEMNKQQVEDCLNNLKLIRGTNIITKEITTMVLHYYYSLVFEDLINNSKHPNRKPKYRGYYDMVTKHCGVSSKTLELMLMEFRDGKIYETIRIGNK